MNYYERIQNSVDYIERNLENKINLKEVAKEAFMSFSNFYRIFFALTGHGVKEYIRKRRISLASEDIMLNKDNIMNIAVKYGFSSSDTFSKAFKHIVGCNPTTFMKENLEYRFDKIDVLDKYYEIQDKNLLDKYPDIKVLKKMDPIKVACFEYYGNNPEINAFKALLDWAKNNSIILDNNKYRLFGYDTTECKPGKGQYGYEACITIDENFNTNDERVKMKELSGGMYAVTTIGVKDISKAWARFKSWVKLSKYEFGTHQWLEEHVEGFNEDFNYDVELFMPICEKSEYSINLVNDTNVAMCKVFDEEDTAPFEAWEILLKWSNANGISNTSDEHKFFAHHNYNIKRKGIKRWYIAMVTIDDSMIINDRTIKKEVLVGGKFVTCNTDFKNLPHMWNEAVNWINFKGERINPKIKWREEWQVKNGKLFPEDYPNIKIYVPIKD
ncbi:effector binding domain-containing protein [Marinisporobacter balticus]|uniref:AraC-like DNA-binding protein n=1 Tax=Marinisporobacter balticus TaxID=2018667 RepID=A0A4V2SB95_9FIRM|nr:effector binding domain-containing protein [Marinisporobacter balticus]TCO74640.1 AraC-like DNA-binding protein [Marinisporobacter balticus]